MAARYLQQLTLEYPDHALVTKVRPLLESLATLPPPPASSPQPAAPLYREPIAEAPEPSSACSLGGLLASQQPMTASRVLMIDAGGVLGSLIGLGLGVVAAREDRFGDPDGRTIFSLGLVGTLSGLAIAHYLSDTWDDGHDDGAATSPHFALAASSHGVTMNVGGQW